MAAAKVLDPEALSEDVKRGLRSSVKYLTNRFLKDQHWTRIGESLANRWDRFQSLSAAIKLMEQHGVTLTSQEEERLALMNEAQMIETLVAKMPQQSKEQFQHFFLQLQLIVSTSTRVREALEQGQPALVEQALNEADSTGIAQYTLKMAIVQAGVETLTLQKQHEAWVKDTEAKMELLVRGQKEALLARDRFAKAKAQLAVYQGSKNEGIKKLLMSFASGADKALLESVLSSWQTYAKKIQRENEIYEEYRERIECAEDRLMSAKASQLKSLTSAIKKKHASCGAAFLEEVFHGWREIVWDAKHTKVMASQLAALEAKLRSCNAQQSANAKKVMERMGAESASGIRDTCFHEWVTVSTECKNNKAFENRVKEAEDKLKKFMKERSEGARHALSKVLAATSTGLMHMCFRAWFDYYIDEKRASELAQMVQGNAERFSMFGIRGKQGARSLMEKAHEHGITMLYLKVWAAWRLFVKVEQLLRQHGIKIDSKRHQLQGVQQMFRNFAMQLETSIRSGQDDDRELTQGVPHKYKTKHLAKSEQSQSLPDLRSQDQRYSGQSSGAARGLPDIHAQDPRYTGHQAQDPRYSGHNAQDPRYSGHNAQDPRYSGRNAQDSRYSGYSNAARGSGNAPPPSHGGYAPPRDRGWG